MSDTSGIDPSSDGIDASGGGGGISDFFSNIGSGISNLFGGGSGSLSDMASQMFGGGGGNQSAAAQTDTTSADQSFLDPSTAAQAAIGGGQNAPQNTQSQNPQGQQNQQNQNQNQTSQTAIDALKKALTNLKQQQRQNPYQTGGGPNTGAGGSMLNRAARIPTGQVPPMPAQGPPNLFDDSQGSQTADMPSQFASAMEFANDNPTPPQSGIDPASAVRAGLRTNAPDTGFRIPGAPANENNPPSTFQDYLNNLRARVTQPAPPIEGLNAPSGAGGGAIPPMGGAPGFIARNAPGSLGELAGRMLGPFGVFLGNTSPAQAPGLTPGQLGMNYRPEDDPQAPKAQDQPHIPIGGGEGMKTDPEGYTGKAITRAPATGKPVKTVDPKTGKAVDPKTGDPLPTHKGEYGPKTGTARDKDYYPSGHGRMMGDVAGMQGVPQMLGQLAQMALPLIMSGMMGGMGGGRGRHGFGGFRGGRFGGHFGGHPGFGGRPGFGGHPGFGFGGRPGFGGFRRGGPMGPTRGFMNNPLGYTGAGQGGGTGNPELDALLQSLGLGGNQNQQGGGGQQGYGPGNHFGSQGGGNPWQAGGGEAGGTPLGNDRTIGSADDVLATIRQRESSGRNVAPWAGHSASGYYQIKPETWAAWARDSGDAEAAKYREAYLAPQAVQDRMARWALRKYGANATYTWAASGPYASVDPSSWGNSQTASGKPGTTQTGGSTAPNPQGNANPDLAGKPPETASAEDAPG